MFAFMLFLVIYTEFALRGFSSAKRALAIYIRWVIIIEKPTVFLNKQN